MAQRGPQFTHDGVVVRRTDRIHWVFHLALWASAFLVAVAAVVRAAGSAGMPAGTLANLAFIGGCTAVLPLGWVLFAARDRTFRIDAQHLVFEKRSRVLVRELRVPLSRLRSVDLASEGWRHYLRLDLGDRYMQVGLGWELPALIELERAIVASLGAYRRRDEGSRTQVPLELLRVVERAE